MRVVCPPHEWTYGARGLLWPNVCDMTNSEARRIPADTFRLRLAMVRTEMGWNYEQAQAATGIGAESWRTWEKGTRRCTDVIGVSRQIADATPYDQTWLALGGQLASEEVAPLPPLPTKRGKNSAKATSIRSITSRSSRDCMSATRTRSSARPLSISWHGRTAA